MAVLYIVLRQVKWYNLHDIMNTDSNILSCDQSQIVDFFVYEFY